MITEAKSDQTYWWSNYREESSLLRPGKNRPDSIREPFFHSSDGINVAGESFVMPPGVISSIWQRNMGYIGLTSYSSQPSVFISKDGGLSWNCNN